MGSSNSNSKGEEGTGMLGSGYRKVSDTEGATAKFAGASKMSWVVWLFLPATAIYFYSSTFLPPTISWVVWVLEAVYAAGFLLVVVMKSNGETIGEYVGIRVRQKTQQQEMVFDRNPDESEIEQPKNNSLLGRIARWPGFKGVSYFGQEETERTQDLHPYEESFDDSYAMKQDDGSVVTAVRVRPANLTTADAEDWDRRVKTLAGALKSAVKGKSEWYNPMRAVNYESRRSEYAEAAETMRRAVNLVWNVDDPSEIPDTSAANAVADPDGPMIDVLADICEERAGVVYKYQETTLSRKHYVLNRVEPTEAVFDKLSSTSGIGSVAWLGEIYAHWKVWRGDEDEHEKELVRRAETRADETAAALSNIPGVDAHPISSTELTQVVADSYRAANMFAYSDFKSLVRQSPSPVDDEDDVPGAGDPGHLVSWRNFEESSDGMPGSLADDGPYPVYGQGTDAMSTETDEQTVRDTEEPPSEDERGVTEEPPEDSEDEDADADEDEDEVVPDPDPSRVAEIRESIGGFFEEREPGATVAGVVESAEERAEMVRSLIAPGQYDRSHKSYVKVDDEVYASTLVIRDWPDNPEQGMLERVMHEVPAGVDVEVTTPIESKDDERAQKELEGLQEVLASRAESLAENKWVPQLAAERVGKKAQKVAEIAEAFRNSVFGLYESGTYITVRATSVEKVEEGVEDVKTKLNAKEAEAELMDHNHDVGFRTTAPTVRDKASQQVKMLGEGVAALFSWSAENIYEEGGVSVGLHSQRGEPSILNLWDRGKGFNVGFFGDIGAGKTTSLTRLLLRMKLLTDWRSFLIPGYDETTIIAIDPQQEFEGLRQLFGGQRVVVGSDTNINPLHYVIPDEDAVEDIEELDPKGEARDRAMGFVESFYDMRDGISLGKDGSSKRGVWETALDDAFEDKGSGQKSPTLKDVFDLFRDIANNPKDHIDDELHGAAAESAAKSRREIALDILENDVVPLKRGNSMDNLSKQMDLNFEDNTFIYFDLQRYDKNPDDAGLMMQLLLDAAYEYSGKNPGKTVIAIDEAHYLLSNSTTKESLKIATRHSRHKMLSLMLATQSVSEFFAETDGEVGLTKSAKIIINNMSARFYHALDEMSTEWGDKLDLTSAEVEFIKTATSGKNGVAEALLQVKEGEAYHTYPLEVDFGDRLNPREFAVNQHDPTDPDKSANLRTYLANYRYYKTDEDKENGNGIDVCEWSFTKPGAPATPDNPFQGPSGPSGPGGSGDGQPTEAEVSGDD